MGHNVTLTAEDGHRLGAYEAKPANAWGGVVILQEIFGVNHHIKAVCDRVAEVGLHAIAPALFDRQSPNFESGYSEEEIGKARGFLGALDMPTLLLDTSAAVSMLRNSQPKVAAIGFCLGGSVAYVAATRSLVDASVCYYGGQIIQFVDDDPQVPALLHFGKTDHTIALSDVEKIQRRHPALPIHLYDAGHGFNCDERASFDTEAASIAWDRSIEFIRSAFMSPEGQ